MPVSRRSFIASAGITAAIPSFAWPLDAGASLPPTVTPPPVAAPPTATAPRYSFFTPAEARFIETACERLIPADASGVGALAADVPRYLDAHLGGEWGSGRESYRRGVWQAGTPHGARTGRARTVSGAVPGNAAPAGTRTPADAFRAALAAIERALAARGTAFERLCAADQDRFLGALEAGIDLGGVWSTGFFEMLLGMTVEGFFGQGDLGRHRDRVSWRLRGFPGAVSACN